jgi:glycosyltransferase involved in cell wall biosynthesis
VKKQLLFVIDSLHVAGAEKSLVTLLGLLDYSKFSVDLILFGHGGELESFVPKEVQILKPFKYSVFASLPLRTAILQGLKKANRRLLDARLKYSLAIRRKKYTNPQKARVFWQTVSPVIESNPKEYDVAISYAQGVPTFYVAEKVKAKKKLAWVNVSYRLDEKDKHYQEKFYEVYEKIVAVSQTTKEVFLETFPKYEEKMEVVYDIHNPAFMLQMAEVGEGYTDGFDGTRILTIGRLAYQKGYDVAIEACRLLKEKGIHFCWYVLGKGPLQKQLEEDIIKNGLEDHFILLGVKSNPYPFIKEADIYVQTSRFEGFGLAIAEARMLNIPVVTTEFDAVYQQMVNGRNGLVVKRDAGEVADAIQKLINDTTIRENITNYLKKEKKGNIEEIQKFYDLIVV